MLQQSLKVIYGRAKKCHLKINGYRNVRSVKEKTFKMSQANQKKVSKVFYPTSLKNEAENSKNTKNHKNGV